MIQIVMKYALTITTLIIIKIISAQILMNAQRKSSIKKYQKKINALIVVKKMININMNLKNVVMKNVL